jgi:hypothetical protein
MIMRDTLFSNSAINRTQSKSWSTFFVSTYTKHCVFDPFSFQSLLPRYYHLHYKQVCQPVVPFSKYPLNPPRFSIRSQVMNEGSNYDYLFKVSHSPFLPAVNPRQLTVIPKVVLIGDSGVGKSYVHLFMFGLVYAYPFPSRNRQRTRLHNRQ